MKLTKEEKINLKSFKLTDKEDFIYYLNEIICRMYKCMHKYKKYLEKMDKYISEHKNDSQQVVYISQDEYSEFVDLVSNIDSYIVNLIGDMQSQSISYMKFRDIIKRRKNKGSLGFEIRELDQELERVLVHVNKTRNWLNHVPESLLCAENKMRDEGKAGPIHKNPIIIYMFEYCELDLLEDLYNQSLVNYQINKKVFQSMKKDYSSLIGEKMRIFTQYEKCPNSTRRLTGTKVSAHIQGLNEIVDEY